MFALHLLFAICAFLVVYHYVIYPAAVILLSRMAARSQPLPDLTDADLPSLTFVIAAYNEERVIRDKLLNTLCLAYPADKLEVLVAADGSNDATRAIAEAFADRGVRVLHLPQRRGKTAALNRAVAFSRGDIIVFSDANNQFSDDALRKLVRHFADPRVGGVCGLKQIHASAERESAVGDGLYWKYESAIKIAESRLGSITGADGEIFAIRRALYRTLDESLINDDAAITFDLVRARHRVLYEPAARSFEQASITIEDDFHVKVRMVSGGFQTLSREWRLLLLPRRRFAFAFLSHKVLRWIAPELLIAMLVSSCVLAAAGDQEFIGLLVLQTAFYSLALIGYLLRKRGPLAIPLYVPFYFCAMNAAALLGLVRYLTRSTEWKRAAR